MDNLEMNYTGEDVLSSSNDDDVLKSLTSESSNIFSGMISGSKEDDVGYGGKRTNGKGGNWESYWNKTDIEPYDPATIKIERSGKSFAWFIFNNRPLTDEESLRIKRAGKFLGNKNYIMRYNGDSVNQYTNMLVNLDETISKAYMPWGSFNSNIKKPETKWGTEMGYRVACFLKKGYCNLKTGVRAINASSMDCCLGKSGKDIVDFIVAWTPDGSGGFKDIKDYKLVGNLTLYLSFARAVKIPLFNIQKEEGLEKLMKYVNGE